MIKEIEHQLLKHWYLILIFFSIPFLIELVLEITPEVSTYSNETWFSFLGSYVGAGVTMIVMCATFIKSDMDNKEMLLKQTKQKKIDQHIERIKEIIQILLLNKYTFMDRNLVGTNVMKFIKDYKSIEVDIYTIWDEVKEVNCKELKLSCMELHLKYLQEINKLVMNNVKVTSSETREVYIDNLLIQACELEKISNSFRDKINKKYQIYHDEIYKLYF